jgi:hypothetical protein
MALRIMKFSIMKFGIMVFGIVAFVILCIPIDMQHVCIIMTNNSMILGKISFPRITFCRSSNLDIVLSGAINAIWPSVTLLNAILLNVVAPTSLFSFFLSSCSGMSQRMISP